MRKFNDCNDYCVRRINSLLHVIIQHNESILHTTTFRADYEIPSGWRVTTRYDVQPVVPSKCSISYVDVFVAYQSQSKRRKPVKIHCQQWARISFSIPIAANIYDCIILSYSFSPTHSLLHTSTCSELDSSVCKSRRVSICLLKFYIVRGRALSCDSRVWLIDWPTTNNAEISGESRKFFIGDTNVVNWTQNERHQRNATDIIELVR